MVSTPNYQFLQPDPNDFVNVTTQLDDNWTKVDQDMNRFDENIFTANGTWTKPARCKRVQVVVVGGGGTGGGVAALGGGQAGNSGGGGGGAYSTKLFLASALSATETVVVGAGGTPPAAGNNPGGAGGFSTFADGKAYVVTANGGTGGLGCPPTAGPIAINGGVGGTATGGDINISGDMGGLGTVFAGPSNGFTNFGAGSRLAPIVQQTALAGQGTAGKVYGGASTGCISAGVAAALAPLAGAPGIVIVRNYY